MIIIVLLSQDPKSTLIFVNAYERKRMLKSVALFHIPDRIIQNVEKLIVTMKRILIS